MNCGILIAKEAMKEVQYLEENDQLSYEAFRQMMSRLSRRIPYWDQIIDTQASRNRTGRKRKEGITYTLLCHSSVVLP